jgi:stage II sporulation protein D
MRSALGWAFFLLFTVLFILPLTLARCRPNESRQYPQIMVRLYRCDTGHVLTMGLEDYLKGVVAAEMPANFQVEALKAQAVAARTVTIRRLIRYGGSGSRWDKTADFSDDPAEGQAWYDGRKLRSRWGFFRYQSNWRKICRAVDETQGLIVTYQGKPIDAVFHSTSGPWTESAINVWGEPCDYLQSVECPYDQESPRYRQVVGYTPAEISRLLGVHLPSRLFYGPTQVLSGYSGLKVIERSAGGRVKLIRAGGAIFRGEDFRKRLGLRSTRFAFTVNHGKLWIDTVGYGHGVGLCQYGANGMAKLGSDFRTILQHYYTNIEIRRIIKE